MKIVVLLSAGLHPISGRPCPVPVELQAIGLALRLLRHEPSGTGAGVVGLHAGAATPAVLDCLGYGLCTIEVVEHVNGDPVAALAAAIGRAAPDLVLAGHRGRGGEDSGLLPYRLAAMLNWPICADAVELVRTADALAVIQALPRGARRRVVLAKPCLVTVHPAAQAAPGFAFAAARCGKLILTSENDLKAPEEPALSEYPYRRRPRIVRGATFGGSAENRLMAATEISGRGQVMINPSPVEAADAICALLERLGLLQVRG